VVALVGAAEGAGGMNQAVARVLVVDDQQAMRDVLREGLETTGYTVATAASAQEARQLFDAGDRFDLALCDIDMPGESGVQLLSWLKEKDPDLAVVMVTGIGDAGTAVSAMLSGALDYVCKPFSLAEVRARAEKALDKRRLVLENRGYQVHLERLVEDRTHEVLQAMSRIRGLNDELRSAYDNTLSALMVALDYRDNETQGHSLRVIQYTERLARGLGVTEPELTDIRRGAMLHDVGKIGIPDSVLRKPAKLDADEWAVMRRHPELGWAMLRGIPFLRVPADIVLSHQERFDGSGYPRNLKADSIPLGARVFAVADTLDAMTSDRPYRKALSYDQARQELIDYSGAQFDPRVVEVFLGVPRREWSDIRRQTITAITEHTHGRHFLAQVKAAAPKD
jgi:putative nucleotidyltransferase with HDIG domain